MNDETESHYRDFDDRSYDHSASGWCIRWWSPALAQVMFPDKANGQLIVQDGKVIGSRIIAQPFTGAGYFHPRASAAGTNGYDAANSGATNLGPTNQKLVDRVKAGRGRGPEREPRQAGSGRLRDDVGFRTGPGYHARQRRVPGAARRQGARHQRRTIAGAGSSAHRRSASFTSWERPGSTCWS